MLLEVELKFRHYEGKKKRLLAPVLQSFRTAMSSGMSE